PQELPSERGKGWWDERMVVDVRTESALCEDRFVEEPDARRDEPVKSRAKGESPERRRGDGRPPRIARNRILAGSAALHRRRVNRLSVGTQPDRLGTPPDHRPRQRRERDDESAADREPCSAPAPPLDDRAHSRKRNHEADAHDDAVDGHGGVDPPYEPMADHRQA